MGKIALVTASVISALLLSVAADRLLGIYLNKTGYFKAMPPYLTNVYDTLEFDSVATISAQGLRNDIVSMPKPPGTYRILALGDSFTFGWGVAPSETWVKLLEHHLREAGNTIEIINAGLPGAGARDERHICKAYASQFDVDAFIWAIYTDDLYQAASREVSSEKFWALVERIWRTFPRLHQPIIGLVSTPWPNIPMTIKTSDVWKQRAASLLARDPRLILRLAPEIRGPFIDGRINADLIGRAAEDGDFLTFVFQKPLYDFALSVFGSRIVALKDRCTNGKPVMVVYMPGSSLVSEAYHPFKKDTGFNVHPNLVTFDPDAPLREITQKNGFSYVSVLSDFRRDGCPGCYYNYDGHFTSAGHARVSNLLTPSFTKFLEGRSGGL